MTAVPWAGADRLDLICDHCGNSVRAISCTLRDWLVAWRLVTGQGWTGSSRATGPHLCPDCSLSERVPVG